MISQERVRTQYSDSPVVQDKPIINLEIHTIRSGRIDMLIKQRATPYLMNTPILPLNV